MIIKKALGIMGIAVLTGVLAVGCDTPRGGAGDRTGGQLKDDKKLSAQVQRELKSDSLFKYPGVEVSTFNGVAQLSGFVDTQAQKTRAEEIASRVPGLVEVQNHIVLKPHSENPNAQKHPTQPRRISAPLATSGSGTNAVDSTR